MIYKEFYSELGKLLYAVANIDHVITEKEKKVLLDTVKNELVPLENHTDEFGTNAAWYAETTFNFMDEQIIDAEAAFNSFIYFIDEHQSVIDNNLKKTCLHIANELALAYRGTNKKERMLIEKLRSNLKKIKNPAKTQFEIAAESKY